MINEHNSLEKIMTHNSLEKIMTHNNPIGNIETNDIEEFKDRLAEIESEAKKNGYTNLKIDPYEILRNDGDAVCDKGCDKGCYIIGSRIETNEEYRNRINWLKASCQRTIDNIEKSIANKERTLVRISEFDKILDNIERI